MLADGHWYTSEPGIPGTPGSSRVWRIRSGSRHVTCPSASRTQVAGGLTSVVDIESGPDGLLHVVELDAASWLAVQIAGEVPVAGGSLKACNVGTGICSVVEDGLSLPPAFTFDLNGTPWISEQTTPGGPATVHPLD